jgi:hypothetical protein
MEPYQERVVQERNDLNDKFTKLGAFTTTPQFRHLPMDEQDRMFRQHSIMQEYLNILDARINAWSSTAKMEGGMTPELRQKLIRP